MRSHTYRMCIVQAVLAYPMGVVRLMDMLVEREVVRNEALLLMIVLTHGNADIQKIAAFEGAFDRLFTIIKCGTIKCSPRGTGHPAWNFLGAYRGRLTIWHSCCLFFGG